MSTKTFCKKMIFAAALLLGALVVSQARAERGAGWVPYRAWKAVEKAAQAQFDPNAKLFKTTATKADSAGLQGAHGEAWIVGAQRGTSASPPVPGFMPYLPQQTFFLVTKTDTGRWRATQLGGMGSYLSKVDAYGENPAVHVPVGLGNPATVCHGVQVDNAARLIVTQGTPLASKSNSAKTQTVFLKGDAGGQPYANEATAKITAYTPSVGWCGTGAIREIPVTLSQVFFASGAAN